MQFAIAIVTAVIGSSGLTTLLVAVLQRKWAKEDKTDNIIEALKVIIIDRVQYLGSCYIYAEEITLDAKETIHNMHNAYKGLGGNGDLDIVMQEVDKLRIAESVIKKKKEA